MTASSLQENTRRNSRRAEFQPARHSL